MSIAKVSGSTGRSKITIQNKGGLPVPVYLTISLSSGKEQVLRLSAEIWKDSKKETTMNVKIPLGEISQIVLGNEFIPEKNEKDNVWNKK